MASLADFAAPVHKSLQQPDLVLGVPKEILVLIFCAAIVTGALLGPPFALSAVVFYIPCYFLSKEDPQMLVMALDSLMQVDYLEG
jgi:type IV secretory pathway VirB3-like protein